MIYRSTDAGKQWTEQDPGIPFDTSVIYGSNRLSLTAVRQIDSLNAIIGDLRGDILRTSNGGLTWQILNLNHDTWILDLQFFDKRHGIIFSQDNFFDTLKNGAKVAYWGGGTPRLLETSDGGTSWDSIGFPSKTSAVSCHYNALSDITLFVGGHGYFYRTTNDGTTYTKTGPFIDSSIDPNKYYRLSGCRFSGPDTAIVFGTYSATYTASDGIGVLMRTTDGGKSWSTPIFEPDVWEIQQMTSIDRDTILAGGLSDGYVLMSTDRGITWRADSLMLDTTYTAYSLNSLVYTASGAPLAVYTYETVFTDIPSVIFQGSTERNIVIDYNRPLLYNDRIFPNPATTTLNIASIEQSTPYRIVDLFGRTVLTGKVGDHTTISVDVSQLPRGVYFVLVDNPQGVPIVAGKLSLVGW